MLRDQRQIWTSPARLRLGHANWLVPYAGLTAGFLVTNRDASLHLSNTPSTLKHYRDFSNYGLAAMAGAVGGLYLWGKATNDPHKEETGILGGAAAVTALLVTEVLKYSFGRERPFLARSAGVHFLARCKDIKLRPDHTFTAKKSASSLREIWSSDSAAPSF